jgi:pimeloyl-ACP methyl ester carboxylesterase
MITGFMCRASLPDGVGVEVCPDSQDNRQRRPPLLKLNRITSGCVLEVMRRRLWKVFCVLALAYGAFSVIGGIALAELQLHLTHRPLRYRDVVIARARTEFDATVADVKIAGRDGIALQAWYLEPRNGNGRDVILLHGVTDNREGMAGFAPNLLMQGYRILLPDARAHGESGGPLATYGILERDDIHRWVDFLYANKQSSCVYGLGESLGAAQLLESLAVEQRFCAVVADSAYSTFRQIAYERVGEYTHTGTWFGRTLGVAPVEVGLLYTRLRYGLDLTQASPEEALKSSTVPVLLIHGKRDVNIPPWHSERMAREFPEHVRLWEAANGVHCGSVSADPQTFWSKVIGWYAEHPRPAGSGVG